PFHRRGDGQVAGEAAGEAAQGCGTRYRVRPERITGVVINADSGRKTDFYQSSMDWLAEKYGRENILVSSIHLDEKTPHMSAFGPDHQRWAV
ncbi:plasmid recombination protein, partial [Klebsiella michiganensis]|uniref:plasmid recombination protein n=1 Tax=Klebsiella michiganensis TaxID=1134687 RepID=UPI0015C57608